MATLHVKDGVQPKIVEMVAILSRVAARITTVPQVTITSGSDGAHSKRSLHYALRALDIRTRNFPSQIAIDELLVVLREEFGSEYDIVLEPTHVHVEWDPA